MNKKFSAAMAMLLIFNLLFGIIPVSSAEYKYTSCVFNTPNVGETFDSASIFHVLTHRDNKQSNIKITLSGKMDGKTKCKVSVFNSKGDFLKTNNIYPVSKATFTNFTNGNISNDFTSQDYDAISEEAISVNLPNNKENSYYIVIEPIGCNAVVLEDNREICEVTTSGKIDTSQYETINYTIAALYYELITVKPTYMFPDIVGKYIDSIGTDSVPFSGYDDDIESYIHTTLIDDIFIGTFGSVKRILDYSAEIIGNEFVASTKGDIYDWEDFDALILQDTYEKILSSLTVLPDESLIDSLNSTEAMEFYNQAAKIIKETPDAEVLKSVSELKRYNTLMDVIDKSEKVKAVMGKIGKGLKWWDTSEAFLSVMLMKYDQKLAYIDALDNIYKGKENDKAHSKAIEAIRKKYSEDFVERFWAAAEEAGATEMIGDEIIDLITKNMPMYKLLTTALSIGFEYSGLGDEINKQMTLGLTNPISKDVSDEMNTIQKKRVSGKATKDDLKKYACLFDIAKSLRVYQLNVIKKTASEDEQRNINNLIKKIKSVNIPFKIADKTGIEYECSKVVLPDGKLINDAIMSCKFIESDEQPYILYNGKGTDLKVHWHKSYYSEERDSVITFIGKPKIHIIYGDTNQEFKSTDTIEDGQEIDLSDYGIGDNVEINMWALVFDDAKEISIKEYEKENGNYEIEKTDKSIAYNYLIN